MFKLDMEQIDGWISALHQPLAWRYNIRMDRLPQTERASSTRPVVSGMLTAKLDGSDEWVNYPAGTNFEIMANSGFDFKASVDTAYQCEYL